jgi:hypothetical protein
VKRSKKGMRPLYPYPEKGSVPFTLPVIKDGDSVGNTPEEMLTARHKERGQWLNYPVIAISGGMAS